MCGEEDAILASKSTQYKETSPTRTQGTTQGHIILVLYIGV